MPRLLWLYSSLLVACAFDPPAAGVRCGDRLCAPGQACTAGVCGEGIDAGLPADAGPPRCGDHQVNQITEECDDGNLEDGDACLGSCLWARCGDGILRLGVEECEPSLTPACTVGCLICDGNDVGDAAGHCFDPRTQLVAWNSARNNCFTVGNAHLATASSAAEWLSVLGGSAIVDPWIDLNDRDVSGLYVNDSGEPVPAAQPDFAAGEPSGTGEHCLQVRPLDGKNLADACGTGSTHSSVCEREPAFTDPGDNVAFRIAWRPVDALTAQTTCNMLGGFFPALPDPSRLSLSMQITTRATLWLAQEGDRCQALVWNGNTPTIEPRDCAEIHPALCQHD